MGGVKVTVLRRTTIALPAVVGGGGIVLLPPVAEFVNTVDWVSGTLQVRVYDNSVTGATAKVTIAVVNCVVAPEAPSVTLFEPFDASTPLAAVALTLGSPDETALLTCKIPMPNEDFPNPAIAESVSVLIAVEAQQGTTVGGSITIGVDLIGRDA
jgi:hypothetical protein